MTTILHESRPGYSYVFCVFSTLLGSKIRTTEHYYRTTHTRKSRFLTWNFHSFWCFMSAMTRNRMIVIVSTVNKQADWSRCIHRLASKPEIAYHWIESREKRHGGRWVFIFIYALLFAPEQPLTSKFIAKGLISMLCIFILFCMSTQLCLHKVIAAWYRLESAPAVKTAYELTNTWFIFG